MRKLAILSVALLPLLGGCVSSTCDYPTATIHWSMQDPNGYPWPVTPSDPLGCVAAGITDVDVYIGTASPVSFPCSAGGAVIDTSRFAPGTYSTTVEGVYVDPATSLATIYDRAFFNLTVSECGNQDYYPVLKEGILEVDYHFAPVDACHGGSMWFALYDETARQDISIIDGNSDPYWKSYYGCYSTVSGTPLSFPVPYGPYTLRGIQEVVNPLTTAPVSVYELCTPYQAPPVVTPGITRFRPPDLLPTLPGAPACF